MSCKSLAEKYGKKIPDSSSSDNDKNNYLLNEDWGCIIDGVHKPSSECGKDTVKSHLTQDGLLHFANVRGMKCINKLTGRVFTSTSGSTYKNINGQTVGTMKKPADPPKAYCAIECQSVTPDDTDSANQKCFKCVDNLYKTNPDVIKDRCPELYDDSKNSKDNNTNISHTIKESLNCHGCVGQNIDNPMGCVNGTKTYSSTNNNDTVLILMLSFVGLCLLIVGGIIIYHYIKKNKTINNNNNNNNNDIENDDYN